MADATEIYNLIKELFFLLDDGDRRLFNSFNLSVPRFYILVHLGEHPGISLRHLSDLILCDKSNITRLIKGLEADGLVERMPHETDGRTYRLFLTEQGERTRSEALAAHSRYNQQRLNCCTDEEQDKLFDDLADLKHNLEEELELVIA